MKTSRTLAERIGNHIIPRVSQREPDFIIGADHPRGPYMRRWYLTPWTRTRDRLRQRVKTTPTRINRAAAWAIALLPNLYLHKFERDDDDRAHHDHPSIGISYLLRTGHIEHTIAKGGIHRRETYRPGELRFMGVGHVHRIELHRRRNRDKEVGTPGTLFGQPVTFFFKEVHEPVECWSIFLFGPTVRAWGFHCPERGWVHWREFTAADKPGDIGRGCE